MRHWKLRHDPFAGAAAGYVPTPPHEEAVARLLDAIETRQRRAVLRAGAGLGKSLVLERALAESRSAHRRRVRVSCPCDGASLLALLAGGLGRRLPAGVGRGPAWKALDEAVRLCRWQRLDVILAIDDCHYLTDGADQLDLDRLVHLDSHPETRLTILQVYRTGSDEESSLWPAASWELRIRLPALTRSDSAVYLAAKLAAAGRSEATFTPRALTRLHAIAEGNPRTLDRLAALALMAAALRKLEIVTPEVVEAVARECAGIPVDHLASRDGSELPLPDLA